MHPQYMLIILATALYTLALFAYTFYNFPWLLSKKKPTVYQVTLRKSDLPIVIVSDLHVGSSRSSYKYFLALLKAVKPTTLVIAGDLIDEKMLVSEKMLKLLKIFSLYAKNVFYTPSTSNHDTAPQPILISLEEDRKRVAIASPILRLCIEGCFSCIYITHGDHASRNGILAHFLETISQKLLLKPFIGGVLRRILGVNSEDWVIYGHSHKAYFSSFWRSINTGCWVSRTHESMQMALALAICRSSNIDAKLLKLS